MHNISRMTMSFNKSWKLKIHWTWEKSSIGGSSSTRSHIDPSKTIDTGFDMVFTLWRKMNDPCLHLGSYWEKKCELLHFSLLGKRYHENQYLVVEYIPSPLNGPWTSPPFHPTWIWFCWANDTQWELHQMIYQPHPKSYLPQVP